MTIAYDHVNYSLDQDTPVDTWTLSDFMKAAGVSDELNTIKNFESIIYQTSEDGDSLFCIKVSDMERILSQIEAKPEVEKFEEMITHFKAVIVKAKEKNQTRLIYFGSYDL